MRHLHVKYPQYKDRGKLEIKNREHKECSLNVNEQYLTEFNKHLILSYIVEY